MHRLPFLVVHGAIVAKLLVLAAAVLASCAVRVVRYALDRRCARRALRERARVITGLAEGSVALHGVWREDRGRCWLDCGGEPVDLDGEVRVVRGTRARWRWRDRAPIHRVHSGDEVIASGQLTRRGGAEAGYRQPAGRWVLGPDRVLAPVEIVAQVPAACPPPLRMRGVLLFAALAAGAYGALQAVGRSVLAQDWTYQHDWDYHRERTLPALDAWHPAVIAAALPGTRDEALGVLAHLFDRAILRTPASVERSIALAGLRGCEPEASALIAEGRFDDAATRAAACGAPHSQARALLLLGRFAEAAAIADRGPEWSHAIGAASIGAGRWADAAAILDERIAATPRTLGALPTLRDLDCLAELLRVHGGDRDAAARLHDRARQPGSPGCRIDEALLLPLDQQAAALAAARDGLDPVTDRRLYPDLDPASRTRHAVDLLLWTLGGEPAPLVRFASSLLDRPHVEDDQPPNDAREAWFAPLATHTGSFHAHAWLAVHHVLTGNWRAAHATARQLHDELAGNDWRWFDAQELDLEIQLREGASPLALDPFADHTGFRTTAASDHAALRRGVVASDLVPAFAAYALGVDVAQPALGAAARGDGGPLADVIGRTAASWSTAPGVLLALIPGVTRDRERLSVALHTLQGPSTSSVFEFLWSLAMRRDLARVASDEAAATRCQAILDRYREMLADRDKLIAFLLVEQLSHRGYGPELDGWFP
jgi:hypothetical protein